MFILWVVCAFFALITIWVLPAAAKYTAVKVKEWVASGKNPPFRHFLVTSINYSLFLSLSIAAFIYAYGRNVVEYSPFAKLENQLFSVITVLSGVAFFLSLLLVIYSFHKLFSAYRNRLPCSY